MNEQPITAQDLNPGQYPINEIFYSLQGEGPWQGEPVVFIRLAGCNLCCTWCDTEYTKKVTLSKEAILDRVKELTPNNFSSIKRVVITGGEPFIHNLIQLVNLLDSNGIHIQIETNGSLSNPDFPWYKVVLVCSPKAGRIHADIEFNCLHYKYVVESSDLLSIDGLPLAPTQQTGKRAPPRHTDVNQRGITVWVMPMDTATNHNIETSVQIALKYGYRLSLRLHKILGVP